ncbi:MAG TPA: Ada metal-binding domain-containing protein [Thermoanaerobaculia bacterium]
MSRRWSNAVLGCVLIACALLLVGRLGGDQPPLPHPPLPKTEGTATEEPVPSAKVEAQYTGNVNTHKFHRLTCRYASCKNCTVRFATRDEALKAGFRPCGVCDP